MRSPTLTWLALGIALAAASPASAQLILSENSSYPMGVGNQFPPGATSVSGALAYSFQVQNFSGVVAHIFQVTLSLEATGIAPGDIANLVLLTEGPLVANGNVVGNTLVFTGLAGHTVPSLSTRTYVVRWDVANLATGDSAQVDVAASGIVQNPTSGDAAAVTHLVVAASVAALGATARAVLVVLLGLAGVAALGRRGGDPRRAT
jgi:hypothetical protein